MMPNDDLNEAIISALKIGACFLASFTTCAAIVMHFDLSGKWNKYTMEKRKRDVTVNDYLRGYIGLLPKFVFIFLPVISVVCYIRRDELHNCQDPWYVSLLKLYIGNSFGIIWAGVIHYILHHPKLYKYHKAHHYSSTKHMTATAYGEVSFVEYCVLDIPLFALSLFLFPTHFPLYLIHFAWHGWDEASAHCGFNPPGVLSYFFDGEFHFHHHENPNVNFSEFGLLDKILGTHHTQLKCVQSDLANSERFIRIIRN